MLAFLTDKHCFLHTKCAKHRNYHASIPQKDNTYLKNLGISDKKRPKMGLFCSYMTKRDLKYLISLYLQGE